MKKLTAGLLAVFLAFTLCFQGNFSMLYAQETSSVENKNMETDSPQPTETNNEETILSSSQAIVQTVDENSTQPDYASTQEIIQPVLADLTISVISGMSLPAGSSQTFTITLQNQENKQDYKEQTITLTYDEENNIPTNRVLFDELKQGTYLLEVKGEGYHTYRQEFTLEPSLSYRMRLYTQVGPTLEQTNAHPGVLTMGEDTSYTEEDLQTLLDELDGTTSSIQYDLDGNQVVNLLDLHLFAKSYQVEYEQINATLESSISAKLLKATEEQGTQIAAGSLADLTNEAANVTLKHVAGNTISEETPVSFSVAVEEQNTPVMMEGLFIQSPKDSENRIVQGTISVLDANNQKHEFSIGSVMRKFFRSRTNATVRKDGTIFVDFQGQIAVKKITFVITETANQGNLVDISKVEFLNDMEAHIPEPEMNIPTNLRTTYVGSKDFTIAWDQQRNITGYEIVVAADGKQDVYRTTNTEFSVNKFAGSKLKIGTQYQVRVQSINGEWQSGYSDAIMVVPQPTEKPAAPDNLSAEGAYQSIHLQWKLMDDSESYNIYYKEKDATTYEKLSNINGNRTTIGSLKDEVMYRIYITGVNAYGEGAKSLEVEATTVAIGRTKLPMYKVINEPQEEHTLTAHIKDAQAIGIKSMVDSPLDTTSTSAFGVVDDAYTSYAYKEDWDLGTSYNKGKHGLRITFDDVYEIERIAIGIPTNDINLSNQAMVHYINSQGVQVQANIASYYRQKDEQGRYYYLVKLKEPIKTSQVLVGVNTPNIRNIAISELRFYAYDSLEHDINALYQDDLHLTLNDDVNEATIEALQKRLDTKDHEEYHPDRDALQVELNHASDILQNKQLQEPLKIATSISAAYDGKAQVGGLNAWQPLGITGHADEKITIFVGKAGAKSGVKTNLQLVAAQFHAQSNAPAKVVANLKTGKNEIVLPQMMTTAAEKGGALYVQYTGNNKDEQLAVRVSGGVKIPVLNLYQVEDEQERLALTQTYMEELETYVNQLSKAHANLHDGQNASVDYTYDPKLCILNTTDLMLDQMMFSLPATQILKGANKDAATLLASMDAMDQMMELFYQHKGLTNSFVEGEDAQTILYNTRPSRHLNVRYMKMFSGAFMYASGNHIGIEYPESAGMANARPIVSDDQGRYVSGRLFGWGIAHEIGHEINQGQYAIAEITNNYFSILAQAKDTNDSVRFHYEDVFARVSSNVMGRTGNVFEQLAMYWQLHLAYDQGYNYQTYGTYDQMFDNLFYARVDSYARRPELAPGDINLTLSSDKDQNIMRLASAAAQKDLREFFQRWGLMPDETTAAYMGQFLKEERAIFYANDDARVYAKEHTNKTQFDGTMTGIDVFYETGSQVDLTLHANLTNAQDLLGYEIHRITMSGGKEQKEVIGFSQDGTYQDVITGMNNRVIRYEAIAVDQYLHRSNAVQSTSVKVEGEGLLDKSLWTATTSLTSNDDIIETPGEESEHGNNLCEPETISAISRIFDQDTSTIYEGSGNKKANHIVLDLGKITPINAIRFTSGSASPLNDYTISISQDGLTYTQVATGTLTKEHEKIFFIDEEGRWTVTYDARYVKIQFNQKNVSLAEIDLYGPTGDNVELSDIGTLKQDFIYQAQSETQEELKIPAGSVVFTGSYKGNPAYNVVVLYDEAGNIVGGLDETNSIIAESIIMAPDPGNALLGEVSEGYWVYWITPDHLNESLPSKVHAELYRVDDAMNNAGQRMVSDTLWTSIPEQLPYVVLGSK